MELTKEEIEMCQIAVGIITDTHTMTDDNMAKWDMLYEKLEQMSKSLPTQRALDVRPAACNCASWFLDGTHHAECRYVTARQ